MKASEREFMQKGKCVRLGQDMNFFFPEEHDSEGIAAATAYCKRCPVREECLAFAQRNKISDGTWGGVSQWERKKGRDPYNEEVVDYQSNIFELLADIL